MTQPTNAQVRKALKGSIAKWEAIAAGVKEDNGAADCPLCWMFRRLVRGLPKCNGCPIKEHVGHHNCEKSPYDTWFYTAQTPKDAEAMVEYLKTLDRKYFGK